MNALRWLREPKLRNAVLIAAFEGWNDAGDAASIAVRHLSAVWSAREFCEIDPEEFFDFTTTRPEVELVDGTTRRIKWPSNTFLAGVACGPGGAPPRRDVVLLQGTEPQLRWRTFSDHILAVAQQTNVSLVILLGSLLADISHRKPSPIMATTSDKAIAQAEKLRLSTYQGPTGIPGVLQEALSKQGIPTISLWASVPHYVSQASSPKAALALVRRTSALLGIATPTEILEDASADYDRRIEELVSGDEEAMAYIERLESRDQMEELSEDQGQASLGDTAVSGEQLAEEVSRFLREQGK